MIRNPRGIHTADIAAIMVQLETVCKQTPSMKHIFAIYTTLAAKYNLPDYVNVETHVHPTATTGDDEITTRWRTFCKNCLEYIDDNYLDSIREKVTWLSASQKSRSKRWICRPSHEWMMSVPSNIHTGPTHTLDREDKGPEQEKE